jgi:cell fate regulator YaaT (PSP1 superfamily)
MTTDISTQSKIRIVSVKFRAAGKRYHFNAQSFDLASGDRVVVETDRGRALGTVVTAPHEASAQEVPGELKSVLRFATDEDLANARVNSSREEEAFRFCLHRIQERKMEMKLVRAEYLFDGSKIIFYFTADGRVDFRELVKDLAHHFRTRIEMRQIGVRDEAKLTGGIGVCGRELCCCTFLTEFAPVSVKMAKEQGLALNPTKISGQCGRLLCCLGYEFETYCALRKGLPKCGQRLQAEGRQGEVVSQNILNQTVTLRLGDGQSMEIPADQLDRVNVVKPGQGSPAPETKAQPDKGRPRPRGAKPERKGPRPQAGKPETASRETKPEDSTGQQPAPGPKKRSRGRRRPKRK